VNRIKAVIFDHGGTLAESDMQWDEYKTATANLFARHGHQIETSQLYEAIMETLQYRLKIRREQSKELNPDEFFIKILNIMEIPSSTSIIEEMIADFYKYYTTIYPDCIPELLENLSQSYKVALLSNTWIDGPRISLEKHGYSKWFDVMVCSCDIGIPKPDPRIYHYTLQKLGVQPNEALMVGDNVEADMKGAESLGITPVWIENTEHERWKGYSIKSVCELQKILENIQNQAKD
jgi:epoxide hydrolase-like predicted phosphatase